MNALIFIGLSEGQIPFGREGLFKDPDTGKVLTLGEAARTKALPCYEELMKMRRALLDWDNAGVGDDHLGLLHPTAK